MTQCSWNMYERNKWTIGETKNSKGACKLEAKNGVVQYLQCEAANEAVEAWEEDMTIPKAKQTACNWLNGPQAAKTSKQVQKEMDKKYKSLTRSKPSMGLVLPLVIIGTVAVGYGAYKATR